MTFRWRLKRLGPTTMIFQLINALLAAQGLTLREVTIVDATLIAAPPSIKNRTGARDPEMHETEEGDQWLFGMEPHIGEDAATGLVNTVIGTAANGHDMTQAHALVHGQETEVLR